MTLQLKLSVMMDNNKYYVTCLYLRQGSKPFQNYGNIMQYIKEAFSKIIGTLLLSYFGEKRGSNNFEIFGPVSEIKVSILIQLPFTGNLVQPLNIETTSYLQQFNAFCNHSAQYCVTCLTQDPTGEIQGGPIILLLTVAACAETISTNWYR